MIDITGKYWGPAINIPGCEKISEACAHCYAEAAHNMHYANGKGWGFFSQPFNVIRPESKFIEAAFDRLDRYKESQVVFVGNMCDMWHDKVPDSILYQIFNEIESRRQLKLQHTYIFLTKRAARMQKFISNYNQEILETTEGGFSSEFPNVWLGVTAENQKRADERIPQLLETPAAHRWISAEPLLGMINLKDITIPSKCEFINSLTGEHFHEGHVEKIPHLDLIIAGFESGRSARLAHASWAYSLNHQCEAANVKFHWKQWGDGPIMGTPDLKELDDSTHPDSDQMFDGIDYSKVTSAELWSVKA